MRVNVEQKIDAVSENFVSVFESARFDSSKKQRGWQIFVPLFKIKIGANVLIHVSNQFSVILLTLILRFKCFNISIWFLVLFLEHSYADYSSQN